MDNVVECWLALYLRERIGNRHPCSSSSNRDLPRKNSPATEWKPGDCFQHKHIHIRGKARGNKQATDDDGDPNRGGRWVVRVGGEEELTEGEGPDAVAGAEVERDGPHGRALAAPPHRHRRRRRRPDGPAPPPPPSPAICAPASLGPPPPPRRERITDYSLRSLLPSPLDSIRFGSRGLASTPPSSSPPLRRLLCFALV